MDLIVLNCSMNDKQKIFMLVAIAGILAIVVAKNRIDPNLALFVSCVSMAGFFLFKDK